MKVKFDSRYRIFRTNLIPPIANLISEWNSRPRFGKGSDQSDNVDKFAKHLWRKYKIQARKKGKT